MRFIVQKVGTSCKRTSYKIVPLNHLNKYYNTGETEVNLSISANNGSEKNYKKHCESR